MGDGIYPHWSLFARPMGDTADVEERIYSNNQKAVQKDDERLFGILQSRIEIFQRENRRWDLK